jgi:hypothetical protein
VRCALLVAGFLGGFLALAFLFGGHAQAAEPSAHRPLGWSSAGEPPRSAPAAAKDDLGVVRKRATARLTGITDGAAKVLKPVLDQVDKVTKSITTGGTSGVPITLPLPSLPTVGDIVTTVLPQAGGTAAGAAHSGPTVGAPAAEAEKSATHRAATAHGAPALVKPASAVMAANGGAADHRDGVLAQSQQERRAPSAPSRFPKTPSVPATPAHAGDSNSPRGGDTHAVLPSACSEFGLTAGALWAGSGTVTYDRSSEVLEFPA